MSEHGWLSLCDGEIIVENQKQFLSYDNVSVANGVRWGISFKEFDSIRIAVQAMKTRCTKLLVWLQLNKLLYTYKSSSS
jgi:hypothetical protein